MSGRDPGQLEVPAPASAVRRRLAGTLVVSQPPAEAFDLFTARGERLWAPGWSPHFPIADADDRSPGTVFETSGHGHTTVWVVLDVQPGRSIRYARVAPGVDAGTVTVTLDHQDGGSRVEVVYDLTTLHPDQNADLTRFAASYRDELLSWQHQIADALERGDRT